MAIPGRISAGPGGPAESTGEVITRASLGEEVAGKIIVVTGAAQGTREVAAAPVGNAVGSTAHIIHQHGRRDPKRIHFAYLVRDWILIDTGSVYGTQCPP
jgi:hypothetical protein